MSPLHDVFYDLLAVFCRYHDSQVIGINPAACFGQPKCALDDQKAVFFYRTVAKSQSTAILEKMEQAVKQFEKYLERQPFMSFLSWHIQNIHSFLQQNVFDEASSSTFCNQLIKLFLDLNRLLKTAKTEMVPATQDKRDISLAGMVQPATYISREGMCRSGTYVHAAMGHYGLKYAEDNEITQRAQAIYDAHIEPLKLRAEIEKLKADNERLKAENERLKADAVKKNEDIERLRVRLANPGLATVLGHGSAVPSQRFFKKEDDPDRNLQRDPWELFNPG